MCERGARGTAGGWRGRVEGNFERKRVVRIIETCVASMYAHEFANIPPPFLSLSRARSLTCKTGCGGAEEIDGERNISEKVVSAVKKKKKKKLKGPWFRALCLCVCLSLCTDADLDLDKAVSLRTERETDRETETRHKQRPPLLRGRMSLPSEPRTCFSRHSEIGHSNPKP